MARERCDLREFKAATLAATGPSLFYGLVLSCRSGGASCWVYDINHATSGHSPTQIKLRVMTSDYTGTVSVFPPIPAQMDTGLFVSLSAGAVGTVFFSARK